MLASGSPGDVVELAVAAVFVALAVRSFAHWLRIDFPAATLSDHALFALHVTTRVGTWLALAAFFLGSALSRDPARFRWVAVLVIVLAGLQVLSSLVLARLPERREPPARPE